MPNASGEIPRYVAPARAFTDETPRVSFARSGLTSFRRYNAEVYEPWLRNRYRDDIVPFTRRRAADFDAFHLDFAHSMRLEHENLLGYWARALEELAAEPGFLRSTAQLWREMGQACREKEVLAVWQEQCERAEAGDYIWIREDLPEMTLEWATSLDPRGVGLWFSLWTEQGRPGEADDTHGATKDDTGTTWHNLRDARWDRVNGVYDIENSPVPVKKSIRAFVADGALRRNGGLRQFILALVLRINGIEDADDSEHPGPETPIADLTRDEQSLLENLRQEGAGIVAPLRTERLRCTYCLSPTSVPTLARPAPTSSRPSAESEKDAPGQSPTSIHSSTVPAPAPSTSRSEDEYGLDSLARTPSKVKQLWRQAFARYPSAYWISSNTDPLRFDPRAPPDLTPEFLSTSQFRREGLRSQLRSVVSRFLDGGLSEDEEDQACNAVLYALQVMLPPARFIQQLAWIAKLYGRDDSGIVSFVTRESIERTKKGAEATNAFPAIVDYQADSRSGIHKHSEPAAGDDNADTPTLIRRDLDEDPDAIWYTVSPSLPHGTLLQGALRIAGPVPNTDRTTGFEGCDEDLFTNAVREYVYRVLEAPGRDLDALGIVLLAIAGSDPTMGPRTFAWFLWRTSLDLSIDVDVLVREMDRMRTEVAQRDGDEWRILREALALIGEQGSFYTDEDFPARPGTAAMAFHKGGEERALSKEERKRIQNKKKKERKQAKKARETSDTATALLS
ncbi:hypothetical protein JCM11491_001481 [Sporobolomyces phaffii]